MAAVPVIFSGRLFDKKNKTEQLVTFIGLASLAGLEVGGGPIEPPPDIPVQPPLEIWPNPPEGIAPHPEHPIVYPPEPPPDQPPAQVEPPHEGWNWSAAKSSWYFLYIPGEGDARPKRR